MTEHWLDRLASAPHTRRQGLLAAVGGAMLGLSFARPQAAQAVERCVTPCYFTAQAHSSERHGRCDQATGRTLGSSLLGALLVNPVYGLSGGGYALMENLACHEHAQTLHKAEKFDCLQAGCSGFQPDPKILCPGCLEVGGKCCPSSNTLTGYGCCRCCDPGGDGCTSAAC